MPWWNDLAGAGLQAAVTLGCALPLVLVALARTRAVRWRPLAAVGLLFVFQHALAALPVAPWLQAFHWHWQATLLTTALALVAVRVIPGLTAASAGITSRPSAGWLAATLPALGIAAAVPLVFFVLGSRQRLTVEGWLYLPLMPGLAEELLFRGVYQTLLNDAFARPWKFGGASFGWSLWITAVLFAGSNGLVAVDAHLHARLVPVAAIAPLMLGLVSGWVRERSNSAWPSAFGHNLSNVVIPLATALSRLAG